MRGTVGSAGGLNPKGYGCTRELSLTSSPEVFWAGEMVEPLELRRRGCWGIRRYSKARDGLDRFLAVSSSIYVGDASTSDPELGKLGQSRTGRK